MHIRRGRHRSWLTVLLTGGSLIAFSACDRGQPVTLPPGLVALPGGPYTVGSDSAEREIGYSLSPPGVRGAAWYDAWEAPRHVERVAAFAIDSTLVTQSEYAEFVATTRHRAPHIEGADYEAQGFLVHAYAEVEGFLWDNDSPPAELADHPAVLVDLEDARAYCGWRGRRDGLGVRLPTELEWEAACRGRAGRLFPWGDDWVEGAAQIDSSATAPVTAHPSGATPEGVLDLAGNVFEWTGSFMPDGRPALKGCSWDDAPGTCRCAFRHGRPALTRHVLIGFRCAASR